ncbi:hypothetical protein HNQ56_003756 [Anaerotaenia torta]|uniref:hypothetical protein n=1 Tax=Anaerotaenia torta TaxID=433293 RepID=UPI003D1F9A3C
MNHIKLLIFSATTSMWKKRTQKYCTRQKNCGKCKKYIPSTKECKMMQEAYTLEHKYDCSLCRHMVADLIECIENERRSEDEL